jgi:toxin-antitoxin system PIN domain toxin
MIALDTNILVYAHRAEMPAHARARAVVASLAESPSAWGLPYPVVHEFLATVTRVSAWERPTAPDDAVGALEDLLASPSVVLLSETDDHLERLGRLVRAGHVRGPRIHDARIAAICLGHGVRELWTRDRDFSAFPELTVRNPL